MADDRTNFEALVRWFNTFPGQPKQYAGEQDFIDGSAFNMLLVQMYAKDTDMRLMSSDEGWFKASTVPPSEASGNWVVANTGLKKVLRTLHQFMADVLHVTKQPPSINTAAIAKDTSVNDILTFSRLILHAAINCEKRNVFIANIQLLDQDTQSNLANQISSMMSLFEAGDSNTTSPLEPSAEHVETLTQQKKQLELRLTKLTKDHEALLSSKEEWMLEKKSFEAKITTLEEMLSKKDQGPDVFVKAEMDRLKVELSQSESKRSEQESLLLEKEYENSELTKKVEELQKRADEASKMKDQLDEYRHAAEKLQKTEILLNQYKKKLEDSSDLSRQLKNFEDRIQAEAEKYAKLEEEYRKVSAFKPVMDSFKDQVASLETEKNNLLVSKTQLESEFKNVTEKCFRLENQKNSDFDQIQALEERIRELEIGGVSEANTSIGGLGAELAGSATTAELKIKIAKLEKENETLRAGAGGGKYDDQSVLMLQKQIEESSQKEKSELIKRHQEERDSLFKKATELEEQQKSQLTQINKLLLEKDELASQQIKTKDMLLEQERLNNELRQTITVLESKEQTSEEKEFLKNNLKQAAEKIQKLSDENAELHRAVKKLKDLIKANEASKTVAAATSDAGTFSEAVSSLQTSLNEKEAELEKLRREMTDLKQQTKKEQRLILSAWYDLAMQLQRKTSSNARGPSSWLGQQRQNLLSSPFARRQ